MSRRRVIGTSMSLVLVLAGLSVLTVVRAEEPRLALTGLDPVMLVKGKEVKGDQKLAVVRKGFKYLFSAAETKATFEKDPKLYEIQLDGECPVVPGAEGNPDLFVVHKQRIYIFATPSCVEQFKADPEKFVP
jgi:YHS domain-containing protein